VDLASHVDDIMERTQTNEEVLRAAETRNKFLDILQSRQKDWIGHVLWHDCYSENSVRRLTAKEEGKKSSQVDNRNSVAQNDKVNKNA